MDAAHAKSAKEVLEHFKVDPETGLTKDQVEEGYKIHGRNGKHHVHFCDIYRFLDRTATRFPLTRNIR